MSRGRPLAFFVRAIFRARAAGGTGGKIEVHGKSSSDVCFHGAAEMYHRHTLAAIIACPVVCPNLLRDYISTRVLLRQAGGLHGTVWPGVARSCLRPTHFRHGSPLKNASAHTVPYFTRRQENAAPLEFASV